MSFLRERLPIRSVQSDPPVFPCGVKVWHDPGEAVVDVIFIHGLTGDRDRTWTHPQSSEPWPKSLLPTYVPKARILTFGYDAYVVRRGAAVSNQLVDHSRDFLNSVVSFRTMTQTSGRPLILVGHSMGGLLCKDSSLQSMNSPEHHLRDFFESTVAIAFLGTPHGGSDLAAWAKIPARALGVLKSANTDLLSVLQTDSEVLARIQNDFSSMLRKLSEEGRFLNVTCFWESLPTQHAGTIVSRTSACLAGYNAISIHANHRDIVRFHDTGDPGFVSVLGELKRWVDDLAELVKLDSLGEESKTNARILRKKQETECLDALFYEEMDSRIGSIEAPNPRTCEWLFGHSCYKDWRSLDNNIKPLNFLWVKGKPGSGKSTLMKRVAQENDRPDINCISFFFNARGAQIENSPDGLYRSLLFQLLQKSKTAMDAFLPRYLEKAKYLSAGKVRWMTTEISEFFHSAISSPSSKPMCILIDALDECEEEGVRKIIRKLEESLENAHARVFGLKICVSSRYYPHISLRHVTGQELFMENHNEADIEQYVLQELALHEESLRTDLAAIILQKSAGVFMWTALVVKRMLKASDQGYDDAQMKNLLQNLPPSLEGLLSDILLSLEAEKLAALPHLAAWLICSARPLRAYELSVALAFTAERPPTSLFDVDLVPDKYDIERFSRYLTDASGGLFEITLTGTVQVIHDSVREFFLHSQAAANSLNLPEGLDFHANSHQQIVIACSRYFHNSEFRQALPSAESGDCLSIEVLASMLCRPMMISFEVSDWPAVGDYFFTYAFSHIQVLHQSSALKIESLKTSVTQAARKMLEGWLVLLYYFVLQTGALHSRECNALDILYCDPSLVRMTPDEISSINGCINLLVIFANKVMKDGFTLKTPNPILQDRVLLRTARTQIYIRLFWPVRPVQLKSALAFKDNPRLIHECYDSATREDFDFGFIIVAPRSRNLRDLEWTWGLTYPAMTVPLDDWRIFRKVVNQNLKDVAPRSSAIPDVYNLQTSEDCWLSMTLKSTFEWLLPDINDFRTLHVDTHKFSKCALRGDSDFERYTLYQGPKAIRK